MNFKVLKIYIVLLCSATLLSSCLTYKIPQEYVPDEDVVYLKQKTEFGPINYEIITAQPYKWSFSPIVDQENPDFINTRDFSQYLKPDLAADAKLYLEVNKHLISIMNTEIYLNLKSLLANFNFSIPQKIPCVTGEIIENFTNATKYVYPDIEESTITVYNDGEYSIEMNDGQKFQSFNNGNYQMEDLYGKLIFAVHPQAQYYQVYVDGYVFHHYPDSTAITNDKYELGEITEPIQQYVYKIKDRKLEYRFFSESDGEIRQSALLMNDMRYNFMQNSEAVIIQKRNTSVVLTKDLQKSYTQFDEKNLQVGQPLSIYFPEGIRIDLNKEITSSKVNPAWPEGYILKKAGNFNLFYTKKDELIISKLNGQKLNDISILIKKLTGLVCDPERSVILPPDLESYRRIHAGNKQETLNWYPSGFQTKDIIIMWPPSVPRYDAPEGEDYFWNTEFYDIFIHEMTHLMIGETAGVFSPVPYWLNEGLALYVEGQWSPETKKYWELTYKVSWHLNKILSWDDVTNKGTSDFAIDQARVHYAQSYKMTEYLITKYGKDKVISYLKSFKILDFTKYDSSTFKPEYKDNFTKTFGTSWEENLTQFDNWFLENEKN